MCKNVSICMRVLKCQHQKGVDNGPIITSMPNALADGVYLPLPTCLTSFKCLTAPGEVVVFQRYISPAWLGEQGFSIR